MRGTEQTGWPLLTKSGASLTTMATKYQADITGKQFDYWTVLSQATTLNQTHTYWLCRCVCGIEKVIRRTVLQAGRTKSCGCKRFEARGLVSHGFAGKNKHRFWTTWQSMKKRCQSPSSGAYERYGAKGISVCERWQTFIHFHADMYTAYLEHVAVHGEDVEIDRIDGSGNYEPSNCRWVTKEQNLDNRVFKRNK